MIRIINELLEIKTGVQFLKDTTGEAKICCMFQQLIVEDLQTGIRYYKDYSEHDTWIILKSIIRKYNIKNLAELFELLAFNTELKFSIEEFNSKKEFNPFFNPLTGNLKIKSKNGIFTKSQVKKILQHKDTKVILKALTTDDYLYDSFIEKKAKIDNLEVLEDVYSYFDGATTFKDGIFSIFTAGMSRLIEITNKNIIIA